MKNIFQKNPGLITGGEDRTIESDTEDLVGDFDSFWVRKSTPKVGTISTEYAMFWVTLYSSEYNLMNEGVNSS